PRWSSRLLRLALWAWVAAAGLLFTTGCTTFSRHTPARTTIVTKTVELPARTVGNFFLVEAKQTDGRTYRFMVDTGSTATLASPALAKALRLKEKKGATRLVRVRGSHGGEVELEPVTLKRLVLGDASFERMPALIYDFADLSAQLGVTIDGVLGFPLFRDTLLTLDYPGSRLVILPYPSFPAPKIPSSPQRCTIAFNNDQNSPLVPVQMGNESFIVLLDSGNDGALNLNPTGLHPKFANGPRVGTLLGSVAGDRRQLVGRLGQNVLVGTFVLEQPVTDLTDQLSSLGGEVLKNFALTFDQHRNRVTLAREAEGPVQIEPRRSTGLSFGRSPAYWRVLSVVPDTPTAQLQVQAGDVCVRINGEPVDKWDYERYAALLKSAAKVTYTFLAGTTEHDLEVPVFELVP
ncbi:MAG TPA: aspartyl protease family protein, partial [Candidatus Didemnitutus sp.]|nr:aspartyl protease family protein [Candidatus Didemnitutus sp.]